MWQQCGINVIICNLTVSMLRSLFILVLSLPLAALAQNKIISKDQAAAMIKKQGWQYGTVYTIILKKQVFSLPALVNDKSYFRPALERSGWNYTDFGSGNYDPLGPRISLLTFQKERVQCKLSRKYKYTTKMKDGSYYLQLSEELEFSKMP